MLKGFPLSRIWVEFHRWSLPAHRGGHRCRSHWGLESHDVGPSTRAGKGARGHLPPLHGGLSMAESPPQPLSSQPFLRSRA